MKDLSPIEAGRWMAAAPKVVQEAVTSVSTEQTVEQLSKQFSLHIDVAGLLLKLTSYMLIGYTKPEESLQELRAAGVAEIPAKQILTEINQRIFMPLREKMRQGIQAAPVAPAPTPPKSQMQPIPTRPMQPAPPRPQGPQPLRPQSPQPPAPQRPTALPAQLRPTPPVPPAPPAPKVLPPVPPTPQSMPVSEPKPPLPKPFQPIAPNIAPLPPKSVLPKSVNLLAPNQTSNPALHEAIASILSNKPKAADTPESVRPAPLPVDTPVPAPEAAQTAAPAPGPDAPPPPPPPPPAKPYTLDPYREPLQ